MRLILATCLAEKDLPRYSILGRSVRFYAPTFEHYIICENAHTFEVARSLPGSPNAIFLVQDSLVYAPNLLCPWRLQMLLKYELTLQLVSKADAVLWLDADTFLLKSLTPSLLQSKGLVRQRWDDVWAPNWITAVASLTGTRSARQPYVVAPVLSPRLVQAALGWLSRRYCRDWKPFLIEQSNAGCLWSCYLLYFTILRTANLYDTFYVTDNIGLAARGYTLTESSHDIPFSSIDWLAAWSAPHALFGVVESNTLVDPTDVLTKWYEHSMSIVPDESLLLPSCT